MGINLNLRTTCFFRTHRVFITAPQFFCNTDGRPVLWDFDPWSTCIDSHRVRLAGAGGWSWSSVREKYCYLAGGWSWSCVREKYCRTGDQPNTVSKDN